MNAARPNMTPERKYPGENTPAMSCVDIPGARCASSNAGSFATGLCYDACVLPVAYTPHTHELGIVAGHTGRETHLLVSLHLSYALFMSCPARALYGVRALCPVRTIFPPALSPASVKSHVLQENHTLLEVACVALNSSHAFSASSCAVMGRCASSQIMLAMVPIGAHFLRLVMCTIVIFQCLNVT
jgi:hypothetical protein